MRFTVPKANPAGQAVKGIVLRVDAFGNLMTNLTTEEVPAAAVESGAIKLSVAGKEIRKFVQTFALGTPGEPVAIFGSHGYLEIAWNRGSPPRPLDPNHDAD